MQQLNPEEYKGQVFSINLGTVEDIRKDNQTIEQNALVTSNLKLAANMKDGTDNEGPRDSMAGTTASLQLPDDLLDSCFHDYVHLHVHFNFGMSLIIKAL